jgi:conjugative transposon TraN protein
MKNIMNLKSLLLALLLVLGFEVLAQGKNIDKAFKKLYIANGKTTSLVFPYAIKTVDKGSNEILVQKAKGVENILLVKAGKQDFLQTNLTVVTADGKLYVFVLNYDEHFPDLNLIISHSIALNHDVIFPMESENQKKIEQYADMALNKSKKLSGLSKTRFDIKLELNGIFIHQDIIYLRVLLANKSRVNYDIDQLHFYVRDQRKTKRTASQEIEIDALFSTSELVKVYDQSTVAVVFALPKIIIPEDKYMAIQIIEKGGGRQLELNIKNEDLKHLEVLNSL